MDKKVINEEMHLEKEWFEQAHKQTAETLMDFINHIMNDYCHDYGTICHATAACALATVSAVDSMPQGGITGFQAGFVMWDFIREFMYSSNRCGLRIIDYDNMLYPQYGEKFEKKISEDTWKGLQNEAKRKIENEKHAHEKVVKHWESIVNGVVPYGYKVVED